MHHLAVVLAKGVAYSSSCFVVLCRFPPFYFPFADVRRGRHVAHVAMQFRCLRCVCVACMFVGGLRTCMPVVGLVLFVRLVLLGVAFLALSAPLLCSSLSLSLVPLSLSQWKASQPDSTDLGEDISF